MGAAEDAVQRVCGAGTVTCRFTHVYPDGPAPYYTVLAPSRLGSQLEQWAEIKAAASDALMRHGGTITHHHAVGRDHRPWYDRQRPDGFARALRAAKRALDPRGDPQSRRADRPLTGPAQVGSRLSAPTQPGGRAWPLHEYRE